jgi:hypothetical protein
MEPRVQGQDPDGRLADPLASVAGAAVAQLLRLGLARRRAGRDVELSRDAVDVHRHLERGHPARIDDLQGAKGGDFHPTFPETGNIFLPQS